MSKAYDVSYWKDRFEHSQWSLPLSKRIIGDDGLFSYVGYLLVKGEDPSRINPETQPVGKYLIGLSIVIFKNPVVYTLILGLSSLVLFFLFTQSILKNKTFSLFATTILFLDPLFFTQFWKSWLDLTQLFFLLLNLYLFQIAIKKKNIIFALLSGLFLGFFVQTKLAVLFPVLLILEIFYLYKKRVFDLLISFVIGFSLGFLVPYIKYFLIGNSPIDFIKLQKYILNFYLSSRLERHVGSILQALFVGNFPLVTGSGFIKISEWNILWPISALISGLVGVKHVIKGKDFIPKLVFIFITLGLIIYSFIPSYPRYLLLIIPFTYIFLSYFIKERIKEKSKTILISLIVVFSFLNAFTFLIPKPDNLLSNFYYNFSNQFFKDIYEEDIIPLKNHDRDKFYRETKTVLNDANVKKIEIKEINRDISLFSDEGKVRIEVLYITQDLGSFSERKEILVAKVGSDWKIKWKDDYLLNNFSFGDSVRITLSKGKRGNIVINGERVSYDGNGLLISVNPEKIDTQKENEMLSFFYNLSGIIPVRLQNTYLENVLPGAYVPLFTTSALISEKQMNLLSSFKGVKSQEYVSRVYVGKRQVGVLENKLFDECCSRIYSSTSYAGLDGIEKKYNRVLSARNGGRLEIVDKNGKTKRIIINANKKDGENVNLSLY